MEDASKIPGIQHASMLNDEQRNNARMDSIAVHETNPAPNASEIQNQHRTTSKIWAFFKLNVQESSKAVCNVCSRNLYHGTGRTATTSTMRSHLQSQHKQEYLQLFELEQKDLDFPSAKKQRMLQVTLGESIQRAKMWDYDDHRAVKLHFKIGEFIAANHQPYSVVEDEGFLRLMNAAQPHYKVPGRTFFTEKIIPDIYKRVTGKVKAALNAGEWVSFTSDIWSCSYNNISMISLTAHYINSDFSFKDAILNTKYFPGRHTGEAIKDILLEMLREWGVPMERVHLLLRDNASNMIKAAADAHIPSTGCFIHTLQLVIGDALNRDTQRSVWDMVVRSRNIVKHFKMSPTACSRFNDLQKELSMVPKKLIQDVATRWNSTYYLLERLHELKRPVILISAEIKNLQQLSPNEWSLMDAVLSLLKPFEEITKIVSSNHSVISEVIPMVKTFKRYLALDNPAHRGVGTLKAELLKSMKETFKDVELEKCYFLATAIDPRYKSVFFSSEKIISIKEELINAAVGLDKEIGTPVGNVAPLTTGLRVAGPASLLQHTHNTFWNVYQDISAEQVSTIDSSPDDDKKASIRAEVERFWSSPLLPSHRHNDASTPECSATQQASLLTGSGSAANSSRTNNSAPTLLESPHNWWKVHWPKFPFLAPVARKYLSAPSSSVYSERIFSEAGTVYEAKRSRLTPKNAETLVFLKHNLKELEFDY